MQRSTMLDVGQEIQVDQQTYQPNYLRIVPIEHHDPDKLVYGSSSHAMPAHSSHSRHISHPQYLQVQHMQIPLGGRLPVVHHQQLQHSHQHQQQGTSGGGGGGMDSFTVDGQDIPMLLHSPRGFDHRGITLQSDSPVTVSYHVPTPEVTVVTSRPRKPTGTTAARLLAEQYNRDRRSHSVQTDTLEGIFGRSADKSRIRRHRLPPKKNECLLCHAIVAENQRDRHVLRYHFKKPVYRCPLCDFTNTAEPSIVRTHLRLKHREFDLTPVNYREMYRDELKPLMRECFGPKKHQSKSGRPPTMVRQKKVIKKIARKRRPAKAKDAEPTMLQCRECIAKTMVQSDQIKIHVAQCHLNLNYLYGCPVDGCGFGSYTTPKSVRMHIEREHGLPLKPGSKDRRVLSEASKHRKQIKKSVFDCFGKDAWWDLIPAPGEEDDDDEEMPLSGRLAFTKGLNDDDGERIDMQLTATNERGLLEGDEQTSSAFVDRPFDDGDDDRQMNPDEEEEEELVDEQLIVEGGDIMDGDAGYEDDDSGAAAANTSTNNNNNNSRSRTATSGVQTG